MRRRARLLPAAICLALAAAATGCTGTASHRPATAASGSPLAATCAQISSDLVRAVGGYVDAYGAPLSSPSGPAVPSAPAPDSSQLQAALQTAQQRLRSTGCDLATFRGDVRAGMSRVSTHDPVSRAVLLRLTAQLTGAAQGGPTTITVRPGADLPQRLAELAAGSVVQLVAGTYRLDAPLALLEGVTVRGSGPGRTTLASTAADAAVLVLTGGRVELRDLTVVHDGPAPADVVVGGSSSALVLTGVRVTGARAATKNAGGNGVLMTAGAGPVDNRGTTLQVTDSTFDRNAAAGILLTGGHVASIRHAQFAANGECGVCFTDDSTGAVRRSSFTGNRLGVAVLDQAKPALAADTFDGGLVAIQASGTATPVVQGAVISGATKAAMIFAAGSAGRVDGSTCRNVPYGIVVSAKALPLLGDNSCPLARGE